MKSEIQDRLKFLTPESIQTYCTLFGYKRITIAKDAQSLFGEDALSLLQSAPCSLHSSATGDLLIAQTGSAATTQDVLSVNQFARDMEIVDEIPAFLTNRISHSTWIQTIVRYARGYEERGWCVRAQLRNSLMKSINAELANWKEDSSFFLSSPNATDKETRVFILCDMGNEKVDSYFNRRKNSARVEIYWLAYFLREWVAELLMEHYARELRKYGVALLSANWAWGFDHYLGSNWDDPTSAEIEKRSMFSKSAIADDPTAHVRFLSKILETGPSNAVSLFEYVRMVPPAIELAPGLARHSDFESKCVNVTKGDRLTLPVPKSFINTVYLMGGCTFFGYAVEDGHTLASALQKRLNMLRPNTWRVENTSLWGGNFDQCYKRIESLPLIQGDIVIVSHAFGNVLSPKDVHCFDMSAALDDESLDEDRFWDRIVHCGAKGYELVAALTADVVLEHTLENEVSEKLNWLSDHIDPQASSSLLDSYIREVKGQVPGNLLDSPNVGAIVMNCNPFTLGHQYLIESASRQVDLLYIFVVEEDKSFFPFSDRINLVRKGTEHLKNVCVVRSGEFIISGSTFPQYFTKDACQDVEVDASEDIEIFARHIAPSLNIRVRFAGEEPFDRVTDQYNDTMRTILPSYGIEFVEIPRKKTASSNNIISATTVRKYLKERNFDALKSYVPSSTYEYLLSFQQEA